MLIQKDCIEGMKELDDNSIDCIVTSPPYNKKGLLGKKSKKTPEELSKFIEKASKEDSNDGRKKTTRYTYHEKGNSISIVQHKNYDDELLVQEIGLNISQGNEKIIKFNNLDSLIEALTEIKKGL